MYRKIVIVGAAAAAIVGSGTAALAVSGSSGSTPTGTSSSPAASGAHHPRARAFAKRVLHGQAVVVGKDGAFVTRDYARGTVSAVSTKLIVVHTADNTNQKFSVTADTKVRLRSAGKGTPGSISDVHVGDTVLVAGTGAGVPAAGHVLDLGTK